MLCPNDQVLLQTEQSDVLSCLRCKSRVFVGNAFSESYPGIRELLRPDDHDSRGRRSACPKCHAIMQPMRLGGLDAWVDACDACQLLRVEKLNESVVRGLKERRTRDQEEFTRGVVAGVTEDQREQGRIKRLGNLVASIDPLEMSDQPSVFEQIMAFIDSLTD